MIDDIELEPKDAVLQETESGLPSVEYSVELEKAPYIVSINAESLAALLREFGMSKKDIERHHIILVRKIKDIRTVFGDTIIGQYNFPHKIQIAFDPLWDIYEQYMRLAKDLVEGRKRPKKDQFSKLLYTKRLPKYLASVSPERGLPRAEGLFLNALLRKSNEIVFHEAGHALDASLRPDLRARIAGRPPTSLMIGMASAGIGSGVWVLSGIDSIIGTSIAGIGGLILARALYVDCDLGRTSRVERSAEKFADSLKNNPNYRSIITFRPRATPQSAQR